MFLLRAMLPRSARLALAAAFCTAHGQFFPLRASASSAVDARIF